MSFHEVRFPTQLSFGSSGGPERMTEIVTLANGHEERNALWKHSRRKFDAGIGVRSMDDIETLIAFFEARMGRLFGFRWKDWADFRSCRPSVGIDFRDQIIGVGDGETKAFQLTKTYRSAANTYTRSITKPLEETVLAGVQADELRKDVHYTVDSTRGILTFFDAPEVGSEVTAGFEFDVPVRFDADRIFTSMASFQAGEIPDVPVLEIRI
jgi:uncharacterized protein (TIGR02217 family)